MCTLPPCSEEEKNVVSGDVCSCLPLLLFIFLLPLVYRFYKVYLSQHCLSLSLYPASKLCLHLLPSPLLCHTLSSSHCPCVCLPVTHTSHQQPLAAFEVLTVVTSWLCATRVSKQGWPSWILSHTIWMAFPLRTLCSQLIGCPLSQWEPASHWGRWIWQQRMLGISQVLVLGKNFIRKCGRWALN